MSGVKAVACTWNWNELTKEGDDNPTKAQQIGI
jgi:hypothetical protein